MAIKSEWREEVYLTLVLSEEEAHWLKCIMQNPLHGQNAANELTEDAEMRLKFFNATKPPE